MKLPIAIAAQFFLAIAAAAAPSSRQLPDMDELGQAAEYGPPPLAVATEAPAMIGPEYQATPIPAPRHLTRQVKTPPAAQVPHVQAPAADEPATPSFHHRPPESAFSGVTLTLDVFSDNGIVGGTAMVRRVGEAGYTGFELSEQADHYYTIDIPPSLVSAPGLEYYLVTREAAAEDSRRSLAFKSPVEPARVPVEGGINSGRELEQYRYGHLLKAFGETWRFPDYGGSGESEITKIESEYSHRFGGTMFTVRYGQGLYKAHTLVTLSTTSRTVERENGFFYSFLGADLRPAGSRLGLSLQAQGGALKSRMGLGYGVQIHYGEEEGMDVAIGVNGMETIGNAATFTLRSRPLADWVVSLGAEISNMPDAKTLGYREHLDLEVPVTRQLKLLTRAGVASHVATQAYGDFGGGLSYVF